MKTKSLLPARAHFLAIAALLILVMVLLAPNTRGVADSNAPTVTNTPEPTNTNTSAPPANTVSPTDTAVPLDTLPPENILGATPIPLPTSVPSEGLSPLNRMLLVCLSVVTVLVIGVIVYLVFYQTRGGGLGDR